MRRRFHPMTTARREVLSLAVVAAAEEKRQRDRCPAGHRYEGVNLYLRHDGRRMCRACRNAQAALLRQQKRMRRIETFVSAFGVEA